MRLAIQNVYLLGAIAALPSHTFDVMNAATVMLTSAASVDAIASAAVAGVTVPVSIVDLDAAVQHRYSGHWMGWALKIETFLGPEMARYCNIYHSACLKGHWTL
jgi:hypothetical protein